MKFSSIYFIFLACFFIGCTSLENINRKSGAKVFNDSISGMTDELDGKRNLCLNGTLPGMAFLLQGFDTKTLEECKKSTLLKSDKCLVVKKAISYEFDSKYQKDAKEWPFVCSIKIKYFY